MVLCTHSPCHTLPNRMVQQSKKIVWLCFTPVVCRKNWAEVCNTVVYILNYTRPTPVEGKMSLAVVWIVCNSWTLVCFWDNVMCTFPNRKGTSGTRRVSWVNWSDIWVKRMAIEFGYLTNGRSCWVVMSSLSQKLCAICAMTWPKPKACAPCPMQLQLEKFMYYKTTKATMEILRLLLEEVIVRIQDRKSVCEKKQPN